MELLATGLKDRAVARRIGTSVTTVERRMRRAMQALGATTRFQLAVRASERGWL